MKLSTAKKLREDIYEKGDKFAGYYLLAYALFSLGVSFIYDTLFLSIVSNILIGLLYLTTKYIITRKSILRHVISFMLFVYPSLLIYQMHGFPLMHMFFPLSVFVLIIYQDFKVFITGFITGIVFYGYYFIQIFIEKSIPKEFLSIKGTDPTLVVMMSLIVLSAAGITNYFIVNLLRRSTKKTLNNIKFIEAQKKIIEKNKSFAHEMSQGNLDTTYDLDDNDELGKSLLQMRESLKQASEKEVEEKFYNVGLAEIADILRKNQNNLSELSYLIIAKLVKYMQVNQGGIYLAEGEDNDRVLTLQGCYAFEKRKYIEKEIKIGQGLVGQSVLEKERIYLTEIPSNYINITSGLGDAPPSSILIVPLKVNDQVEGAIELASFKKFKDYEIEFLEKAAESIASTISTVRVNERTTRLFEQSSVLTEQMRAQEEEMLQNMEELQATQEESKRTIDQLQNIINEKEATIEELKQQAS